MPSASHSAILGVLHTPVLTLLSPPLLSIAGPFLSFFCPLSFIFRFPIWLSVFLPFCLFSPEQWAVDNGVNWSPHDKMTYTGRSIRSAGMTASRCVRERRQVRSEPLIVLFLSSHTQHMTLKTDPHPSHLCFSTSSCESKLFPEVSWICIFGKKETAMRVEIYPMTWVY